MQYFAAMLLDKGCHHLTVGLQFADGRLFIIIHEAAVGFNVSTKDCGEFAFKTFVGHGGTPFCYGFKQKNTVCG